MNGWDLTGEATRNYNLSISIGISINVGLIFDDSDVYFSMGGGVATPGVGGSATYGRGKASRGLSANASGGFGAGGSVSWNKKGKSYEAGLAAKGASLSLQYNSCLTCKSSKNQPAYKRDSEFLNSLINGKFKQQGYNHKR